MKKILLTLYRLLNSRKLFFVIVGLLVVQAAWFALTAKYPMAFDENYHFGIIKIYAQQWLPFFSHMPPDSGMYGDLTRYDSYLYHYLMSFPYRLISLFVHQEVAQIIILRFLNIGLFVGGMFLFRRVLLSLHLSEGITNFSFLMLVLIPVVPFLAATINYDNLVFLVVPLVIGLALKVSTALSTEESIPAIALILLFVVGGLGSLVKYAFLPIFLATIIYIIIIFIRTSNRKEALKTVGRSFKKIQPWLQAILIISIIVTGGLLAERYGVNLVKYKSIEPDCSVVQKLSDCLLYGPYARNYHYEQNLTINPAIDPPVVYYLPFWLGGMIMRLYFAINYNYANFPPLPIPIFMASTIGILGFVLSFIFRKYILKVDRRFLLFALIIGVYLASLFYINFKQYLHYKIPFAINGRYAIIILPLIFAWFALAYQRLFQIIFKARTQTFLTTFSIVILFLALQGGGALTHLVRAEPSWYWGSRAEVNVTLEAKKLISPLIIGRNIPWPWK